MWASQTAFATDACCYLQTDRQVVIYLSKKQLVRAERLPFHASLREHTRPRCGVDATRGVAYGTCCEGSYSSTDWLSAASRVPANCWPCYGAGQVMR